MTHTNHRQGTLESLSKDWIVFMYAARGINHEGAGPKMQAFLHLALRHNPVNIGSPTIGNMYDTTTDKIMEGLAGATKVYAVFDDGAKAAALIMDAKEANLGVSVIVSGIFEEVEKICQTAGIKRHTAQCSLGVWGKTDHLPPPEILDITTMCGHGLVSFNLVRRMTDEVRKGNLNLEKAAVTLAKPCICGVFNPERAEELLERCLSAGI